MKIELLRQLAFDPIGDLPHNNLSPLLQQLGDSGIQVRHLIPFLSDNNARLRLAEFLKARGHGLRYGEVEAANIMGWDNCIFTDGATEALYGKNSRSTYSVITYDTEELSKVPRELLETSSQENKDLPPDEQTYLMHIKPLSVRDLSKINSTIKFDFVFDQKGVKMVDTDVPISRLGVKSWIYEVPTQGYQLIKFVDPNTCAVHPTAEGWQEQYIKLARTNGGRLSTSEYIQAILLYKFLRLGLPQGIVQISPSFSHWAMGASNESVTIRVSEGGRISVSQIDGWPPEFMNQKSMFAVYKRFFTHGY